MEAVAAHGSKYRTTELVTAGAIVKSCMWAVRPLLDSRAELLDPARLLESGPGADMFAG